MSNHKTSEGFLHLRQINIPASFTSAFLTLLTKLKFFQNLYFEIVTILLQLFDCGEWFWAGAVNESASELQRESTWTFLSVTLPLPSLFSALSLCMCLSFPADRKCTEALLIFSLSVIYCFTVAEVRLHRQALRRLLQWQLENYSRAE